MSSPLPQTSVKTKNLGCFSLGCLVLVGGPLLFLIGFLLPFAGFYVPIEFVVYALFGWIFFLTQVLGELQVDFAGVMTGVTALILFSGGLHYFLRWFYSAYTEVPRGLSDVWKLRWTVRIVGLICVMFTAGISMTGLTHQVVWLTTSQESIIVNRAAIELEEMKKRHPELFEQGLKTSESEPSSHDN